MPAGSAPSGKAGYEPFQQAAPGEASACEINIRNAIIEGAGGRREFV